MLKYYDETNETKDENTLDFLKNWFYNNIESGLPNKNINTTCPLLTPLYGKRRLPIGSFKLKTKGEIISGNMELDIYNAVAKCEILTTTGKVSFETYIHFEKMLVIINVLEENEEVSFNFTHRLPICPERIYAKTPEGEKNPNPVIETIDNIRIVSQPLFAGGEYATGWIFNNKTAIISIGNSFPNKKAKDDVIKEIHEYNENLYASHKKWWNVFYKKSFISIPDTKLESLYYIQLYKLASATRENRPPSTLWVLGF